MVGRRTAHSNRRVDRYCHSIHIHIHILPGIIVRNMGIYLAGVMVRNLYCTYTLRQPFKYWRSVLLIAFPSTTHSKCQYKTPTISANLITFSNSLCLKTISDGIFSHKVLKNCPRNLSYPTTVEKLSDPILSKKVSNPYNPTLNGFQIDSPQSMMPVIWTSPSVKIFNLFRSPWL